MTVFADRAGGCDLFVPRTDPALAAGILRQARDWRRTNYARQGGSLTTRIGDNVHYVAIRELETGDVVWCCRAATVTDIGGGETRGLYVLDPLAGASFVPLAPYDSPLRGLTERDQPPRTPAGGTWHGLDECNPDGATLFPTWRWGER